MGKLKKFIIGTCLVGSLCGAGTAGYLLAGTGTLPMTIAFSVTRTSSDVSRQELNKDANDRSPILESRLKAVAFDTNPDRYCDNIDDEIRLMSEGISEEEMLRRAILINGGKPLFDPAELECNPRAELESLELDYKNRICLAL